MTDHLIEIVLERLNQLASQVISPKPDAVFAPAARLIREYVRLNEDKFNHLQAYCKAADADRAEIRRLRELCAQAFAAINYAIGESHHVHDNTDPSLVNELLKIATEERITIRMRPSCEHGVAEGDWCEPCNKAYKQAAKAAGLE